MNRTGLVFLVAMAMGMAWGCVEGGESADPTDETPSRTDDLVNPTPGGKFDTGYLSNLAVELEAVFAGEIVEDVSDLDSEAQQARLDALSSGGWEAQRTIDGQIKYARNQMNTEEMHINLSSSDVEVSETSLQDGVIRLSYEASLETIVTAVDLEDSGRTIEDVIGYTSTAVLPAQPSRMAAEVGEACLSDEHEGTVADYNYFYYFEPGKEGCAEAMAQAGIGRVDARLEVHNLAPSKTVYPEYDQLIADGRIDVVAFFGAADHDWEPGEWDWGTGERDQFTSDLRSRGFRSQASEEGELYTRTVGDLEERVTVIGPETLKLLKEDSDGLFVRHVSANEIIFYNGHSFYGSLSVLNDPALYPGHYQIFFMNSCWSYEYYTKQIFQHNATEDDPQGWLQADVVNDTESGWFHNMGDESRILLTNLLAGAESRGVDGDRYYTWDRIVGAMNRHALDAQRTGSTHEIYGVSGVRTNRYDPTASPGGDDGQRFESTQPVTIPDNDPTGAASTITVPGGLGTVDTVTVRADIEHTYIGDLTVTLAHGGRSLTLHAQSGGETDNLRIERAATDFSGLDAEGDWVLTVVDGFGYDTGRLVNWSVTF